MQTTDFTTLTLLRHSLIKKVLVVMQSQEFLQVKETVNVVQALMAYINL